MEGGSPAARVGWVVAWSPPKAQGVGGRCVANLLHWGVWDGDVGVAKGVAGPAHRFRSEMTITSDRAGGAWVRGRVLVVEDDETIRHLVSMALFEEGYE